MKNTDRLHPANICLALFIGAASSSAASLFLESFDAGLGRWTGKTNDVHHGVTVPDPVASGRGLVLTFTAVNGFGDIFTTNVFSSTNTLAISFDYLGLRKTGSGNGDLGGYLGISEGLPGVHTWLASTAGDCSTMLVDNGQWHRYTVLVPGPTAAPFHVVLEDYAASPIPGDVFFDNIQVADWPLLTINQASLVQIVLTWPTNAPNYALEATDSLNSSVWNPVTNTAVVTGDLFSLRLPVQPALQFFRLHRR